jgi:hypothetical protein
MPKEFTIYMVVYFVVQYRCKPLRLVMSDYLGLAIAAWICFLHAYLNRNVCNT